MTLLPKFNKKIGPDISKTVSRMQPFALQQQITEEVAPEGNCKAQLATSG